MFKRIIFALVCVFAFFNLSSSLEANINVGDLKAAHETNQIIIVAVTRGSEAKLTFYQQNYDNGEWDVILKSKAFIGKNGLGKTREGDLKTPVGTFKFTHAFGIKDDPGCEGFDYVKVDDTYYWVGDVNSDRYNQFVSTRDYSDFNKNDSEHIIDYVPQYNYALNINYNEDGTPNLGSAIFLHCVGRRPYTGGCIAVPERIMSRILKAVKADCRIIIDYESKLESGEGDY